ncbi:vesicle transport protein SEC20 [Hyalella azteca]|uniref:Vesicle transport protein SEC20 n=1 Tax=Hyalella azteca TaxID=294128 RepID=A0A8B7NQL9_HYAAZ|nr:vesicle transport protein SEC20 [Hyalella azteca]
MTVPTEHLYGNVIRQDIVKCNSALKIYLQTIQEHKGDEAELNEISASVRTKLSQLRGLIANLKTLAKEEDNLESRKFLLEDIVEQESALQQTHSLLRNALFRAQLAITERQKNELFSYQSVQSDKEGHQLRHRMSTELALKQSSQLTNDLLNATRMIQDNTEKSTKTLDKLVESSETLTATREELKGLGSVISQARKLLSKYGRRENTDKLLIFLGFVFFAACCLVVIRNRLNIF